ncbi:MAG: T9SS type A sorting domain-containing protein [Bacteroidota bacterium]
MQFFSNPIGDQLSLKQLNDVDQILIYNSSGMLIKTIAIDHRHEIELDTKDWHSGLYIFVLLSDAQAVQTFKMVKA